jgi:hypothetical protein
LALELPLKTAAVGVPPDGRRNRGAGGRRDSQAAQIFERSDQLAERYPDSPIEQPEYLEKFDLAAEVAQEALVARHGPAKVLSADPSGPGLTSLIAAGFEGNDVAAGVGGELAATGMRSAISARTSPAVPPTSACATASTLDIVRRAARTMSSEDRNSAAACSAAQGLPAVNARIFSRRIDSLRSCLDLHERPSRTGCDLRASGGYRQDRQGDLVLGCSQRDPDRAVAALRRGRGRDVTLDRGGIDLSGANLAGSRSSEASWSAGRCRLSGASRGVACRQRRSDVMAVRLPSPDE